MTTDDAGRPRRAAALRRLAPWAVLTDIVVLGTLALSGWVFMTGGTRFLVGPLRVSLLTPWRIAAVALLLAAVRQLVLGRPPLLAWLVGPLWRRLVVPLWRWPDAPFTLPVVPAPAKWWQGAWGALLLVAGAWAVMTWPQVTGMSCLVSDRGDPYMKIWQLSWVSHQLLADPLHLYDANIFFPEARTLAYSDAMIGPSIVAAPLGWFGVGDVLVFNLLFAAGLILSGVAMFALVRRLTGDWPAAIFAALAYAFLPYRFGHYAHLELQFTWGIPLALLAAHRVFETGRLRDGVLLGLVVGFQATCSLYYAAYLGVFLVAVGAVLWRGSPRPARSARALAAGVMVASLCAWPVLMPHVANRASVGERDRDAIEVYSATPSSYIAAPGRNWLYGAALADFGEHEKRLFAGFLLVAVALVGAWPLRSVPRLAYVAGSILAFDASLGSNGLLYPVLFDFVPGFRGFRVPARFGVLTATGLVVLAGYGVARLGSRARTPRARGAVVALLAAGLLLEYRSFPVALVETPRTPPPVSTWLARLPQTVIAEVPAYEEADFSYMFWSRLHWHRLVNGQSGFFPPWYRDFEIASGQFPVPASIAFLRSRGVRHVIVHASLLSEGDRDALERRLAEWSHLVRVVAVFPESGDRVFEIR
jgi:hypothetical protein